MRVPYHYINVARMVERIESLARYSTTERGVTRLSFTKESEAVNRLVTSWMKEAGMTVDMDELNNVIGRFEGRKPDAPTLLIGSHLDSVTEGGKYDGVLGVIAGIEVIHALFSANIKPFHPIEIIAFCDEEGTRFQTTFLGSKAIVGQLQKEDLLLKDGNGISVAEALQEIGLNPDDYQLATRAPQEILGYLELHIEQGPVLEQMEQACGVVSGIAGSARYRFQIEGEAGHAGTVPLSLRKDALLGASELIYSVEQIAQEDESVVATVGSLSVFPGASNVIPGLVEGTLDIRSIDDNRRKSATEKIIEECQTICKRRELVCEFQKIMESPAVACSSDFIHVIKSVLMDHHMQPFELVSGAGHDAMVLASLTDIGMIFVRCRGGRSHHPDESVTSEDLKIGTSILLDTALRLTN